MFTNGSWGGSWRAEGLPERIRRGRHANAPQNRRHARGKLGPTDRRSISAKWRSRTKAQSVHVLDVFGHLHPTVLARLIDREDGRREARIGKRPDRNGDDPRHVIDLVVDRRPARWAEPKGDRPTRVTDADKCRRRPLDLHPVCGPTRLLSKRASRSPLAGEAVADRNTHRIAFAGNLQLPAAALRLP